MINLNSLTPTQRLDAELYEVSLCGRFAIIAAYSPDGESAVWHVAETDGQGAWIELYYASESMEDAQDVFGILNEVDYEFFFDLFEAGNYPALAIA